VAFLPAAPASHFSAGRLPTAFDETYRRSQPVLVSRQAGAQELMRLLADGLNVGFSTLQSAVWNSCGGDIDNVMQSGLCCMTEKETPCGNRR
jgi:hypothetical protein